MKKRLLSYHADEDSAVLQIGDSNIKDMTQYSQIGENFGYAAINIGCHLTKLQNGGLVYV